MCDIAPLDPAGVGQDQRRAVGGVTGPSVPHTSHVLGGQRKTVVLGVSLVVRGLQWGPHGSQVCEFVP